MHKIMQFFKIDTKNNSYIFQGNKMEIFISMRYEANKCLKIGNTVSTIGIFDFIINDKIEDGLFLPAIIEMEPSNVEIIKIGNDEFAKVTFLNGDIFIKNREVQKVQDLGYVIFYEIINQANRSKHLDYFKSVKIFDLLTEVCGIDFGVNRKVFELIMAHIHRDKKNLSVFYRQTDMKQPPEIIQFRDIAHGTVTTTGKIIGNYFDDSLRSAIVNPTEEGNDLENIMRA